MSAATKPEIYISYIPNGKIGLEPQIYASYIPTPEKLQADLSRKVTATESIRADSFRQVGQGENIPADIFRRVIVANATAADTARKLSSDEQITGDTFRRAVHAAETHADIYREVKVSERTIGDTSRRMGLINVRGDLRRQVNVTTINTADTCRKIGIAEEFPADIYLRTARGELTEADTFRKVEVATVAIADACRQICVREKFSAATVCIVVYTQTAAADIFLQITAFEKIAVDLLRGVRDVAHADTVRKLVRIEKTVAQTVIRIPHILTYTVLGEPPNRLLSLHKPKLLSNDAMLRYDESGDGESDDGDSEESDSEGTTISESSLFFSSAFKFYGIAAIYLTLNEKTLSDKIRLELTNFEANIGDTIALKLLDYEFEFVVEETSQTGMVQTVSGVFNKTNMLYEWFSFSKLNGITGAGEDDKLTAKQIMEVLAKCLDLTPAFYFGDFTPENFSCDSKMTYADIITLLFGWTSQVPTKEINVFIRGKFLYVVQRGAEGGKFGEEDKEDDEDPAITNISNMPHPRPTISRKIYRALCNNPNNNDNDNKQPFSGTIVYKKEGIVPYQAIAYMCLTYSDGLLQSEVTTTQTGMFVNEDGETVMLANHNVTSYSYISQYNEDAKEYEYYISSKNQSTTTREQNMNTLETYVTEQNTSTSYGYSTDFNQEQRKQETYLFHESEQTTTTEYQSGDKDKTITTTIRDTYHYPCGNGWYAQLVYLNGVLQGSNISQGKPGGAVSQYITDKFQESFHKTTIVAPNEANEATPIFNLELPIEGTDSRHEWEDELAALDGSIEETVTIDIVSKISNGIPSVNKIIDFNTRIMYDQKLYFLVSNTISFTPRNLIQKLQLIRWC